jgi:short/branched chain acyl-CoA dehydrogenase
MTRGVPTSMSCMIMVSLGNDHFLWLGRDDSSQFYDQSRLPKHFFYFQITHVVGFAESVGRVLEDSRVSVAWIPVGICLSALEKTIEYVKKREAFGAPLASNQLIQG